MKPKRLFLLTISMFSAIIFYGQPLESGTGSFDYFSKYFSPEKLYLHIDRNLFTPGETLWFKGYLQNSSYQCELPPSRFIYVELLQDTLVVVRVKVKGEDGMFEGHIDLPEDIKQGEYLLRGYSNWNMNWDPEYMFHSGIAITTPVSNEPSASVAESIPVSMDFYPEGGRYFAGRISSIAFKIYGNNPIDKPYTGHIENEKGEVVASFKSQWMGMGQFFFIPREGEKLHAVLDLPEDAQYAASPVTFPIPLPSADGGAVNVKTGQGVMVNAFVKGWRSDDGIKLILHNGSEIFFTKELSSGELSLRLDEKSFSPGINHAVLLSKDNRIISERLFFVFPDLSTAEISPDKKTYSQREKITAGITLRNSSSEPVGGTLSVSVVPSSLKHSLQEDNITSYFFLSSELVGKIDAPQYYFDSSIPAAERESSMDLLMLVQGWRYYDLPAAMSGLFKPGFGREYTQSLSGSVESLWSKDPKEYSLEIMAPQIGFARSWNLNGSRGFVLDSLDFCDSTYFFIEALGKRGKRNKVPEWDEEIFAPYCHYPKRANSYSFSKKDDFSIPALHFDGVIYDEIEAATILEQSYVNPVINPSPYGQRYEKRQIRERNELEQYDHLPLLMYIAYHFTGFSYDGVALTSRRSGTIRSYQSDTAKTMDIFYEPPVYYLDGMKLDDVTPVVHLYVEDVENVVVLNGPDAALYRSPAGVVLISTRRTYKGGKMKYANEARIKPLGWQRPSKFFSPKYETREELEKSGADLRNTIYWNPSVKTDSTGKAAVEFYSSDTDDNYLIRVEGVDGAGNPFSAVNYIIIK